MKNPWLDIASYKLEDAYRFKGRTDDIKKFTKIVLGGCMTVLYANSGIGKTSFINAGIIPELMNEKYLPIRIVFPTEVLNDSNLEKWLYDAIRSFGTQGAMFRDSFEWQSATDVPLDTFDGNLWWLLHTSVIREKETGQIWRPLIIFDQFEEIFTKVGNVCELAYEQQNRFFGQISAISSHAIPEDIEQTLEEIAPDIDMDELSTFKIIFSLRKEYLSDFDYWTNDRYSITELHQNRMFLLPMTRAQAEEVITQQPIDESDPGVYCHTLNSVKDLILNRIDPKHKDSVEPIMLSLLCSKLYDLAVSSGKDSLTPADIDKYDINTIIYRFYEDKLSQIISRGHHRAEFELSVLDKSGHRNRTKSSLILDGKFDNLYKNKLEDAHIIRIEKYGDEDYVELIHDMLADAVFNNMQNKKERKAKNIRTALYAVVGLAICALIIDLATYSTRKQVTETTITKMVEGTQISFAIVEDSTSVTEDDQWTINVNLKWTSDTVVQDTTIVRNKQTMYEPIGPIFANLKYPLAVNVDFQGNEDLEYDINANPVTVYDSLALADLKFKVPLNIKREIVPLKGRALMVCGEDSIPVRNENVFLYNISAKTDANGDFSLLIPKNDTVKVAPVILREGLKFNNVRKNTDGYDYLYTFDLDRDTTSFFSQCDSIYARSSGANKIWHYKFRTPNKDWVYVYYYRLDNDDRVICYFYYQKKGETVSRLNYFLGEGQIDKAYDKQGLRNFTLLGRDCAGNTATLRATVKNGFMYVTLYYSDKEKYLIDKIKGIGNH